MFSSASGWLDIAVERCDHECDQGQAKVENTALVKCHGMRCQPSSDQLSFAGPGLPSGIECLSEGNQKSVLVLIGTVNYCNSASEQRATRIICKKKPAMSKGKRATSQKRPGSKSCS